MCGSPLRRTAEPLDLWMSQRFSGVRNRGTRQAMHRRTCAELLVRGCAVLRGTRFFGSSIWFRSAKLWRRTSGLIEVMRTGEALQNLTVPYGSALLCPWFRGGFRARRQKKQRGSPVVLRFCAIRSALSIVKPQAHLSCS